MRRKITIIILIIAVTVSALWGVQRVRFFDKLPMLLHEFSADEQGYMGRGPERGGMPGPNGREQTLTQSLARWINVLAYLSIFAFVVFLAYYGERGLCNVRARIRATEKQTPETVLSTSL